MNDDNSKKYMYPVEELDAIIEKMANGITPMMSPQMKIEVELRRQEIMSELGEEDIDEELFEKHEELVKQHIEERKKRTHTNDVVVLKMSEQQKKTIHDDVATSIVRMNPNSSYNVRDDMMYESEERRVLQSKLSRLHNCYYKQVEYVAAMEVIRDAIDFSLKNDYPWLDYEDAVRQFNEGKIKFTYCNLPKLYIDYATQVTDPDILKGVLTGDVLLVNNSDNKPKRKKKKDAVGINYDYGTISEKYADDMIRAHNAGYDTPISPVIRAKSSLYNRFSLPSTNKFSEAFMRQQRQTNPYIGDGTWDWSREGAGEAYFNMIYNKKTNSSNVIQSINAANNNELNNVILQNMTSFLSSLKEIDNMRKPGYVPESQFISTTLQVNEEAAAMEKAILNSIRMNNPTK